MVPKRSCRSRIALRVFSINFTIMALILVTITIIATVI